MKAEAKQKLLELLADGSRWTKREEARNQFGTPVSPHSENAVCWCLMGASAHLNLDTSDRASLMEHVYQTTGRSVVRFNDYCFTNHQDVLKVLREIPVNE